MHALFKWRTMDSAALRTVLDRFCAISRGGLTELAKFVKETFYVFFALLASPAHSVAHEHTFKAIIHMLSLLTDKKLPQVTS